MALRADAASIQGYAGGGGKAITAEHEYVYEFKFEFGEEAE